MCRRVGLPLRTPPAAGQAWRAWARAAAVWQWPVEGVASEAEVAAAAVVVFRGGGGGGRRSDIELKHDVVLLGHLANGLGYYRFSYLGSSKPYVGVIAQEVQSLVPEAVTRGRTDTSASITNSWG
jgi:hypothetical protein